MLLSDGDDVVRGTVRGMDRKESKKMKLDKQRTREAGQLDPAPDSELVDSQGDRLSSEGSDSDCQRDIGDSNGGLLSVLSERGTAYDSDVSWRTTPE